MSAFDLAVGVDGPTMNQAGSALYAQLYPRLFTGSQTISRDGLDFRVSWDVKQPPRFVLSLPERGAAMLRAHLRELDPPGGVRHADLVDALAATLEQSTFQLVMPDVAMTVEGEGGSGTDQVAVTVVVQASSAGGQMTLRPLKATGATDNPSDQWFINEVILPQAMQMAGTLLGGVTLPPLTISGVQLTAPTMLVSQERVIAMASLAGKPVPTPPFPDSWPASPFFALMSEEARLAVARAGTAGIVGKQLGHTGSVDIGIGTAQYGATARIGALDLGLGSAGSSEYTFRGPVTGNVNAGVTVGCTTIGVNYTLYAEPEVNGTISLSIDGAKVRATTSHLAVFVLVIKPDGGVAEWILSALTYPLLQSVTAVFSPLITLAFNGIGFDVFDVPSFPVDVQDVHLRVVPTAVRFSSFGGMQSIEGSASITG